MAKNFFDQFDNEPDSPPRRASSPTPGGAAASAPVRTKPKNHFDQFDEVPAPAGAAGAPVRTKPNKDSEYFNAFNRGTKRGYTYGYSAEAEAAARSGDYLTNLKRLKGEEAALTEKHPIASGVGETLGMLLNPLSYVGGAVGARFGRGAQVVGNAANQALIGGAEGYSKNYKKEEAEIGATMGGVFSIVGDTAGHLIQKVGDKAARQMVYDKLDEIISKKRLGYEKTLRKVFNADDSVSTKDIVKHASDYAYKIKNEGASLVEPAPYVHTAKEGAAGEQEAKPSSIVPHNTFTSIRFIRHSSRSEGPSLSIISHIAFEKFVQLRTAFGIVIFGNSMQRPILMFSVQPNPLSSKGKW